ncbi:hypothetical protein B0H13DRAFT_1876462 [Mycena leptocephala]|nr:hypothetical protein B0H13DRAFT_1876462 [Mycena leptocephala]
MYLPHHAETDRDTSPSADIWMGMQRWETEAISPLARDSLLPCSVSLKIALARDWEERGYKNRKRSKRKREGGPRSKKTARPRAATPRASRAHPAPDCAPATRTSRKWEGPAFLRVFLLLLAVKASRPRTPSAFFASPANYSVRTPSLPFPPMSGSLLTSSSAASSSPQSRARARLRKIRQCEVKSEVTVHIKEKWR